MTISAAPMPVTSPAEMPDWERMAARAAFQRRLRLGLIIAFLVVISVPVILAYFWMIVISFTAKTGGVEADVLWRACAVLVPAIVIYSVGHMTFRAPRIRLTMALAIAGIALVGLILTVGNEIHLNNYRFLVHPNVVEEIRGTATAGGQFPWVWEAFFNSLFLASMQTIIAVGVSTLAGYYLSRFAFAGRSGFLQSMLVLQAFPAITLVIPIFIIIYWIGLLNTLFAPMLVITTLELPFFIFIMKGFFDAVPWDIEMSALTDGATRRQAFRMVVLPQVRVGMIAIGVFAFIKGWEEYVFVTALRTGSSYWVMSTYLYYVADDVMGVDYGLVAAVSVFYVIPSLLLYVFCQKYLTQMTLGGVKG